MKFFAVKDMKAQLFRAPFAQRSAAEALRGWQIAASKPDTEIHDFPNDFRLYELGSFDDFTGQITQHPHLIDLGSAADYQKTPPASPTLISEMRRDMNAHSQQQEAQLGKSRI